MGGRTQAVGRFLFARLLRAEQPLALPMAAFSARWWVETGPLLIALAFVPAAVFLWEAHGAQVFGENPFRP